MSTAQLLTDCVNPKFRRVYNRNDILVTAMLAAGLEEYITSGFIHEELSSRRKEIHNNLLLPEPKLVTMHQNSMAPQQLTINSRSGSKYEHILEELHQLGMNSST